MGWAAFLDFIYHLGFAWRLYTRLNGMSWLEAWEYPCDRSWGDGDPIEDADEEISCMYADGGDNTDGAGI